jgi:hypothetical protein
VILCGLHVYRRQTSDSGYRVGYLVVGEVDPHHLTNYLHDTLGLRSLKSLVVTLFHFNIQSQARRSMCIPSLILQSSCLRQADKKLFEWVSVGHPNITFAHLSIKQGSLFCFVL